jgi:hypothetical protein
MVSVAENDAGRVSAQWQMKGINTGSFMGLPPSGISAVLAGVDFIQIEGDGIRRSLLQPGVFNFGLLQDWNVGVGVFPDREKVLIRGSRLRRIFLQRICASESKMRKRTDHLEQNNAGVAEDFLELGGGLRALARSQVRFSASCLPCLRTMD